MPTRPAPPGSCGLQMQPCDFSLEAYVLSAASMMWIAVCVVKSISAQKL